jgi:hypothetical protein
MKFPKVVNKDEDKLKCAKKLENRKFLLLLETPLLIKFEEITHTLLANMYVSAIRGEILSDSVYVYLT